MNKIIKKRGFTIVELVIVIAVIAILAAILIPTFSSIVSKANAAAIQAELKSAKTQYIAEAADDKNFNPNLELVFKHINDKGKTVYYLEENGSFVPAEGVNFIENAPKPEVVFMPLQYKSGTDEWLFAEFAEGTVGVIAYLGGPEVYSYGSLVQMRDVSYNTYYGNTVDPTWKATDSGFELIGSLKKYTLTTENNPLGFDIANHHYFLSFSILAPENVIPNESTIIKVNETLLLPANVVEEFVNGSSDWIFAMSQGKNLRITIDWDGGGLLFAEQTYFINCSKLIFEQ